VVDAKEVGWQGPDWPFRLPKHTRGGVWRTGDVHRWILGVDPQAWLAWASHAQPAGYGHPAWGLFVYDAATIRQRQDEHPPDDEGRPKSS
jgi:hypothetical protein